MIESEAKRRLADEYDAAQERGEVAKSGQQDRFRDSVGDDNAIATAADLGLRRDEIHAARKIRDAEKAQPGIVKQTLDRAIEERRGGRQLGVGVPSILRRPHISTPKVGEWPVVGSTLDKPIC